MCPKTSHLRLLRRAVIVTVTALAGLPSHASAPEVSPHALAKIHYFQEVVDEMRSVVEQPLPANDEDLATIFRYLVQAARSYSTMVGTDTTLHNQRYSQWEADLSHANTHLEAAAVHAIYTSHSLGDAAVAQGANPDRIRQLVSAPVLTYLGGAPPEDVLTRSAESIAFVLSEILRAKGVDDLTLQLTLRPLERSLPQAENHFAQGTDYLTAATAFARSLTARTTLDFDVMIEIERMLKRFAVHDNMATHDTLASLSYQLTVYLFFTGVMELLGPNARIQFSPDS